MIELPFIFLSALLLSSHCIGMCGPLALALGANDAAVASNVTRQLIYSLGRVFTYSFAGAVAGFGGLWLSQQSFSVIDVQAWLAVFCGIVLIVMGLTTAGVLPAGRWTASGPVCAAGTWLRTFLNAPELRFVFLAGVFTGFIPCGLVYAFVAKAASTSSMLYGTLVMVCFGLGTVPSMVLTGCGGSLLSLAGRARVLKVAAWCVVVTGIVTIARGTGYLDLPWSSAPGCPMCP
jgi:sulfite exporter TauE/SafE